MKLVFKAILILLLTWAMVPSDAMAQKNITIFQQPNNAANYVRLRRISNKEAKKEMYTHPYSITGKQLGAILSSLRYSRRAWIGKKVKVHQIFEPETVEKYTPFLVEALAKASPYQQVVFSVAQQRPLVILRNDHLTQLAIWVKGDFLYFDFFKTEAKITGDYKTFDHKAANLRAEAKSLRISLDPQEGQVFSGSSPQEIKVDLRRNWPKLAAKIAAKEAREKSKKKYIPETPVPENTPSPLEQKNAEARLEELKRLKQKGLISSQDYESKKKEILQDL